MLILYHKNLKNDFKMGRLKTTLPEGYFGFRSKTNSKGERRLYLIYFLSGRSV